MVYIGQPPANKVVKTADIEDNAVTSAKIDTDTIAAADLGANSVDSSELVDGSIDTSHIGALQVTEAKIAADAVTLAKMASGTDGNIISYDASGNPVAIATGNDGQVLTSAGAGQPPAFETPSSFNADGAVVFNESSNDVDFRVESNGNANMLHVDGGNDGVAIGTTGGGHTLQVYDTVAFVSGSSNVANTAPLNVRSSAIIGGIGAISIGGNDNVALYNHGVNVLGLQAYSGINFYCSETNDDKIGTKTERMRIDSNGDVGIGTTNPTTKLYVTSSDNATSSYFENSTSSGYDKSLVKITGAQTTTDASYVLFEAHNGNASGKLVIADDGDVTNTNNSYGAISDKRIKQNITDASSQWDDIKALKIKNFKLKSNTDLTLLGVVAQDLETDNMNGLVEETKPSKEDVAYSADFGTIEAGTEDNGAEAIKDDDGNITGYEDVFTEGQKVKSVKYSVLYMKAIKALQESMERIEQLEAKVTALENA